MITRYEADSCRHAKKLANKIESEAVRAKYDQRTTLIKCVQFRCNCPTCNAQTKGFVLPVALAKYLLRLLSFFRIKTEIGHLGKQSSSS